MSHLALYLLGPPRIEQNGKSVELVRRKAVALLAYLAVTRQSHTRETLANLLWPEYDQRRARADLRRTLSVLNKALGSEWLHTEHDRVSLNRQTGFWLDVSYFQRRIAECQGHTHPVQDVCAACLSSLTDAITVYRDDFLAGFTLPDSANFDEWQFFQTEQLRAEFTYALEQLVVCYRNSSDHEKALLYAQRWVNLDPLHEPAHRHLIWLYAQTDQRAAALRQYQLCVETLHVELGISPATETTALYEHVLAGDFEQKESLAVMGAVITDTTFHQLLQHAAPRHNLPLQPTLFVGRRRELAEISQRLADPNCRLLTLIGPGGVGKTRLAVEAASQALSGDLFSDGVYFVPLTSVSRADFLVSAIGQALTLAFYGPESFAEDPKAQLLNYLQERKILLVMDNFEHLLSGADLFVDILQIAPNVQILVTSQERLNLQAEWVEEIQGMRVPESDDIESLEDYSAVRLFMQNARRIQANFALSEADKPWLIRICQLVGGMPLGLQLASAWVRQLTCQEIVQEIEHNLDFLATSLRDIPERHRSLRAVFAHSWKLLSDEERRVYRQLSVFQGGFRRPAAEHVARASLPLLSSLTDKSFLHKHSSGRYEIHEVLRQYAADKLHETPLEEGETKNRTCDYYVLFLESKTEALKGNRQKETLSEIGEEIENLQTNWHRAVVSQNIAANDQFVESLYYFYEMRGWVLEGVAAFDQTLVEMNAQQTNTANLSAPWQLVLGKTMARQGALCLRLGLTEKALYLLEKSLLIFRRSETPQEIAFALNYLGSVAKVQGDYQQAQTLWKESLAIFRNINDGWGIAWSLNFLGHLTGEMGDYLEAKKLLQESLTIHKQIGNRRGIAGALNSLGYVVYLLGEYEEARSLVEQSLAIRRRIGYRRGIALSLNYLGHIADALGNIDEAKHYFYKALKVARDIKATPLVLDILVGLAALLAKEGRIEQAITLLAFPLHHSASGQETRTKAQNLLLSLEPKGSVEINITSYTSVGNDPGQFEAVVNNFLITHQTA